MHTLHVWVRYRPSQQLIRQHSRELLAFVAQDLHGSPPGISITLERLELPASQVNWLWLVGSADPATEQAVLRFFQTDAGKTALVSKSPDAGDIEFKLASTLLRLPLPRLAAAEDPVLPADLAAAAAPLRGDEEGMVVLTKAPPQHPICVPSLTGGWLQVAPHTQFSQVSVFSLPGQAPDTGILGAWLADMTASTAHGYVAAIAGASTGLVLGSPAGLATRPAVRADTPALRYMPGTASEGTANIAYDPEGVFVLGVDGVLRTFAPDFSVVDYRQLDPAQVNELAVRLATHSKVLDVELAPGLQYLLDHPATDGRSVVNASDLLQPTNLLVLPTPAFGKSTTPLHERDLAALLDPRQPDPFDMQLPTIEAALPQKRDLFYDGAWHAPESNEYKDTVNPGTGRVLFAVAQASAKDVDTAVTAAHKAFLTWRTTSAEDRAGYLRRAGAIIREHASTLALLDSLNTGNPVAEMARDARVGAHYMDYFGGLIPMVRGETIPLAADNFHYTVREPLGVVGRIIAYNHPLLFAAKMAAPLAAGNTVVIKPPDQAPVSCLRLAELLADVFPPGVLSILPGGPACGKALATHALVKKITLIGSVPTGKAIQRAAADTLKPTLFELGGKNALIAFPDADLDKLVAGVVAGMNFTWAGQSCGSTSRVFLHASHHDEVVRRVVDAVQARFRPGVPTDPATTMGSVIDKTAYDRVLGFIESAHAEGATLACGGKPPALAGLSEANKAIAGGYFIEPTIFTDVQPHMRIAREEIFGPVMSVFRWSEEADVIQQANSTPYGLTAAVFTENMAVAQRTVAQLEAGFIWVNQVSKHFVGVPFGGFKESGSGREECLEELLSFTQTKSVNIFLG
ncbi:hypothetical protein SCUCBS95973_002281 [Sporothrix curviconia]|uniref:aldehyde dehydrogenase (NAD(+)) n=1 Tax=Sporothrix curviconia TaxID=1260050 RepID=A0ABP0B5S0_9PEZI